MNKGNFKFIVIACFLLFMGFAGGSWIANANSKQATQTTTGQVPVHKLTEPGNLLKANELIAPDLWRLSVDPFWIPAISPLEPLPIPVPAFANFPAQAPEVKTVMGDQDVRVIVNVPGLSEKDVDVSVGSDAVTIKGQKDDEHKDKGMPFQAVHQSFEEAISLPCKVDGGKAKATVKDGVLTISMPKAGTGKGIAQKSGKSWQ